jgi:hypothetical protein
MKYYLIALILSLLYGVLGFYVADSLFIGLGIGAIFFLVLSFLVVPLYLRHEEKERKRHECYRFLNTFIISLSVSQSGERALEAVSLDMRGEEKEIFDAISQLSLEERISYLARYFESSSYAMFLSLFQLYENQGGDVLELAEPLLKEITLQEETGDALEKIRYRNLLQFASLWGMSYLVLGFTRYGLSNFYSLLSVSIPYLATEMVYFVIALFAFVYFGVVFTGEKITFQRRKENVQIPAEKAH